MCLSLILRSKQIRTSVQPTSAKAHTGVCERVFVWVCLVVTYEKTGEDQGRHAKFPTVEKFERGPHTNNGSRHFGPSKYTRNT